MPYSHRRSKKAVAQRRAKHIGIIKAKKDLFESQCQLTKPIFRTEKRPFYEDTIRSQVVRAVGKCVLCGFSNLDALEVHHIDHHHHNNTWNNITVICANCHVLIHKRKLDYWEELNRKDLKISCEIATLNTAS